MSDVSDLAYAYGSGTKTGDARTPPSAGISSVSRVVRGLVMLDRINNCSKSSRGG